MEKHEASKNKEVIYLRSLGRDIKKRVCDDIMSVPFLLVWSILICLLLEYASGDKVNAFLKSTFDEGVGLKTIIGMLVLSFFLTGMAWLIRPERDSTFYKMLLAPARAARSVCMTTLAFVLGLAFAIAITNGLAHAINMAGSLGLLGMLWLMLNFLEALSSDASNHREKQYKWCCIVLGVAMMLSGLALVYSMYCQINSGLLM